MNLFFTNIAYAATPKLDSFINNINAKIINPLIILLFALAAMYFLWGVFEFILNQENEEKKTTGKSHMIWGIIGITVMMGVFSIMNMIIRTLNIDNISPQQGTVQLR